jgi:hypothetical protein
VRVAPVHVTGRLQIDGPSIPPACQDVAGRPLQSLELVPADEAGLAARIPLGCGGEIDTLAEPGAYRLLLRSTSRDLMGTLELSPRLVLEGETATLGTLRVRLVEISGRVESAQGVLGDAAEGGCPDLLLEDRSGKAHLTVGASCTGTFTALVPPGIYRLALSGRLAPPGLADALPLAAGRTPLIEAVDLSRPRDDLRLPVDLIRVQGRLDEGLPDPGRPPAPCLGIERVLRLRPATAPLVGERQLVICGGRFAGLLPPDLYAAEILERATDGRSTDHVLPALLRLTSDAAGIVLASVSTEVTGLVKLGGAPLAAPVGKGPNARVELVDDTQPRHLTALVSAETPVSFGVSAPPGNYRLRITGTPRNGVLPESPHVVGPVLPVPRGPGKIARDLGLGLHRLAGLVRVNGQDPEQAACAVPTSVMLRRRDEPSEVHALAARCVDGRLIFDGVVYAGAYALEVRRGRGSVGRGHVLGPREVVADALELVLDVPERTLPLSFGAHACRLPEPAPCAGGMGAGVTLTLADPQRQVQYVLPRAAVSDLVTVALVPGRYTATLTWSACSTHGSVPVTAQLRGLGELAVEAH